MRSSLVVTIGFATSTVLGFLFQMMTARVYGLGVELDTFIYVNTLAQAVYQAVITAIGAILPAVLAKKKLMGDHDFPVRIMLFSLLVTVLFAILFVFLGRYLCSFVYEPGSTPWILSRNFILYLVASLLLIVTQTAVAVFNSRDYYYISSICIVIGNLVSLPIFALNRSSGPMIMGVAICIGSVVQAACSLLIVFLKREKGAVPSSPKSLSSFVDIDEWRGLAITSFPLIASVLVFRAGSVAEKVIGGQFGDGNISALGMSVRLLSVISVFLSIGLVTTTTQRVNRLLVAKEYGRLRKEMLKIGIRLAAIVVMVAAALFVFSHELIGIIFEGGHFDKAATSQLAYVLRLEIGVLVFPPLTSLIAQFLYAVGKIKMVSSIAIIVSFLDLILKYTLGKYVGFSGLAVSNSITYALHFLILLFFFRKSFKQLGSEIL